MFTSDVLQVGEIYTRKDLMERFHITDSTINTGIFQPAGHDSVWLFVTEQKSSDRTQYTDRLDGDTLYWDGQTAGYKDALIIQHAWRGLELLLFYRTSKVEHPGAGFRYEGRFCYASHQGEHPAHFTLERVDALQETAARDIEAALVEDEQSVETFTEGALAKALVNRYERNPKVRAAAIRIHGTRCQGCGFSFSDVYGDRGAGYIEVHHLRPIASYGGEVVVNPETDMAVLCANCHRMIHRDPAHPLSVSELRGLLASQR